MYILYIMIKVKAYRILLRVSLPSNINLYQIGSMFFAVNSDTNEIWAGLIGPPYASFASLSLGLPVSSSRHAHTHSVASGLYSHSSKGKVINYGEGELQNGKAIEVLSLQTKDGRGGGGVVVILRGW